MNGAPGDAASELLLATKLHMPPARTDAVSRARLLARVEAGLRRKLLLVSAPAGFGKTTLLSIALRDNLEHVAWLSLDSGDKDPVRFWVYILAALNNIHGGVAADALQVLRSRQAGSIENALTMVINALTDRPHDCILVLDDYHVIDAHPIHDAVMFLIERLPPRMQLVIPALAAGSAACPRRIDRAARSRPALHGRGGDRLSERGDGPSA